MKVASIHNFLISISDDASSIFYGGQRRNSKKDIPISEFSRWFKDKGDKTLRLEYPLLDSNSIVFDVGGYVGDFANKYIKSMVARCTFLSRTQSSLRNA